MKKAARGRLLDVTLFLMTAVALLILFWSVKPYESISFTPFKSDKATYSVGDTITLTNEFCWDGTPFTVNKYLQSPINRIKVGELDFYNGYALPAVAERYQQGCQPTTVTVSIPQDIPPGKYRVAYVVEYNANPIRTIDLTNESNEITITP